MSTTNACIIFPLICLGSDFSTVLLFSLHLLDKTLKCISINNNKKKPAIICNNQPTGKVSCVQLASADICLVSVEFLSQVNELAMTGVSCRLLWEHTHTWSNHTHRKWGSLCPNPAGSKWACWVFSMMCQPVFSWTGWGWIRLCLMCFKESFKQLYEQYEAVVGSQLPES